MAETTEQEKKVLTEEHVVPLKGLVEEMIPEFVTEEEFEALWNEIPAEGWTEDILKQLKEINGDEEQSS